jgi:hypothetical protein
MRALQTTYRNELSSAELKILDALPKEAEKHAFSICRDMALRRRDDLPAKQFPLSLHQLGLRLGLTRGRGDQTAYRIMKSLCGYGLMKLEAKGERRQHKVKSKASIWKWLL